MKTFFTTKKPGYALATILILMGVVLFSVGALVSVSALESKISRSEQEGIRAYYVAEAGEQDALWRLNHISSYSAALQANNLNITYSATNIPSSGQGFTVTLTNGASGAGYGIIDVVGTSSNNSFTASRHIVTDVFQGPAQNPVGTNAVMTGQSLSFSNGSANVVITSGDIYGGSISSSGTVNAGSGNVLSPGNLSGTITTTGSIETANHPPAAPTAQVPGFDFSSYTASNNCTVYYNQSSFENYAASNVSGGVITFPGPVTCVDGGLSFSSWLKNDGIDTLNITGMLVILNGGLDTIGDPGSNFTFNLNDPGNGKAGIFAEGRIHNIKGTWNVNGVVYTSANILLNNSPALTINGALIAGTNIDLNAGAQITISYVASRVGAVGFTGGTPSAVSVQHFEDKY